ncbi:MAG: hypothetical protein V2J07_01190 [Anaerolineae bacterium]|jgi:hypothetical protein|nr:hypothetical protein [Anaerolineae bacterium]
MKRTNKLIVFFLILLSLFSISCICSGSELLQQLLPDPEAVFDEIVNDIIEENVSAEIQTTPTVTPAPAPTYTSEPEPESSVWIVAWSGNELIYVREDGGSIQRTSREGTLLSVAPAPVGGRVAVVRSENENSLGHLWLELLDLETGGWVQVTQLTNENTVINDWMADLGESNREANIAISFIDPIWTADGSTVIFLGAQEGQFTRPYAYHLDTGQLHDLMLAGGSHYYDLSLSPDGEFITAASAFGFGTGAGYSMDAYSMARVSGGEAALLFDASYNIDIQTWGWLDDQTVVISDVDIMAGPRNLRTLNIYTGEAQVIVKDYVNDVAVSTDHGSVMFVSIMGELLDYSEPQQIAESGLYYWDQSTLSLQKLNDFAEYRSRVEWSPVSQCFYADLPRRFTENEDEIWAFTASGGRSDDCLAINPKAQDLPRLSPSGDYYAWANLVFSAPELNAFYVQSFDGSAEIMLAEKSVFHYQWHPVEDVLIFLQNNTVFWAGAPDFRTRTMMQISSEVEDIFLVTP